MAEGRIKIGQLVKTGWDITLKNFLFFLGILFIVVIINMVLSAIFPQPAEELRAMNGRQAIAILGQIIITIVATYINLGLMKICLEMVDGKKPPVSTLFSQYRLIFRQFVANLLYSLIAASPIIIPLVFWYVGNIVASVLNMPFLATILGLIFGLVGFAGIFVTIYLAIKFMFSPYYIVDKNSGIIESLKLSSAATAGAKKSLLIFELALLGINFIGVLLLGIGLLITIPLSMVAMAAAYRQLAASAPAIKA